MFTFSFFAISAAKPLASKILPSILGPLAVIGTQTAAQMYFQPAPMPTSNNPLEKQHSFKTLPFRK
ncbi:MAG: hypothetical protein SFW66_05225 [Gammaproteobacteria bacterium]|nr:hypothetical protein [Gammaproteobacteria bacterium]